LTFESEDEKIAYTRCGIWGKFKKPGLVKEVLGKLGDLTPELIYHIQSLVLQEISKTVRKYPSWISFIILSS